MEKKAFTSVKEYLRYSSKPSPPVIKSGIAIAKESKIIFNIELLVVNVKL